MDEIIDGSVGFDNTVFQDENPRPMKKKPLMAFCSSDVCAAVSVKAVWKDVDVHTDECPDCSRYLFWQRMEKKEIIPVCTQTVCCRKKVNGRSTRRIRKFDDDFTGTVCVSCRQPIQWILRGFIKVSNE